MVPHFRPILAEVKDKTLATGISIAYIPNQKE
jgi:hypothetical protein